MAETDDTTKALPGKPQQVLGQLIETQRAKLLQAHAVMICLREVLLYAEGEDAVIYAEAANAAAVLANEVAEGLDSVNLQPVLTRYVCSKCAAHRARIEIWLSDRNAVNGPSHRPTCWHFAGTESPSRLGGTAGSRRDPWRSSFRIVMHCL